MSPQAKRGAVLFLVGALLGAAAGGWAQRRLMRRSWLQGPDPARALARLDRKLGLDEGQKAAVKAVLEEKSVQIDALRRESLVKLAAIREQTHQRIRQALRPEQQAKLDAASAHFQEEQKRLLDKDGVQK